MEPTTMTNITSEMDSSGTSTIKVRSRRRLERLLSQLNPVKRDLQSQMEQGVGEDGTETRNQIALAASPSPPVCEFSTPMSDSTTSKKPDSSQLSRPGFTPEQSCEDNVVEQVIDSLSNTERPTSQPSLFGRESPAGNTSVENSPVTASSPQSKVPGIPGTPLSRMTTPVRTFCSSSPSSLPYTDAPRANLVPIVCAIGTILGIVAVVLLVFRFPHDARLLTVPTIDSEHDARALCTSVACREVLALLALTANRSVPPCDDFYQHVCGNWFATVSPHHGNVESPVLLSYAEENLRSFSERVHRSLRHLIQTSRHCAPQECQMARFYQSCLRFVSNRNQSKFRPSLKLVFERAEIDHHPWIQANDSLHLLETVVGSCLHTGLTSVVNVRRNRNGDIFVDMGESLRHTLGADRSEDRLLQFFQQSFMDLRQDGYNYSYEEILTLDAKVEDVRKVSDVSKRRFQAVQLSELPSPLSELPSLAQPTNPDHLSTTTMHQKSSLHARALESLSQVIELLGSVNLGLAGLYLLLVTASQILKYEYLLLPPHAEDDDEVLVEACVRAAAEHFTHRYPFWLANTMETAEARFYLNAMVVALGRSAANGASVAQPIPINGSLFAQVSLQTITVILSQYNAASHGLDLRQEVPDLADDFIDSVIQLHRQPLVGDWQSAEASAQSQLQGDVLLDSSDTATIVTVPSLFLSVDLLHPDASEESVDYSTVGVRLLLAWANHEATLGRRVRPQNPFWGFLSSVSLGLVIAAMSIYINLTGCTVECSSRLEETEFFESLTSFLCIMLGYDLYSSLILMRFSMGIFRALFKL